MNKIHCKAPFVVRNIFGNGDMCCCCNPAARTPDGPLKIEDLQNRMLTGDIYEHCRVCTLSKEYDTQQYDTKGLFEISFVIADGCNAVCRTCRDFKQPIVMDGVERNMKIFKDLYDKHRKTVNKLCILGGETFLYPNQLLEILDFIEPTVNDISVYTNGSIPDENLIKLISDKNITVNISIDGNDETNHLIRVNCHMDKIKETIGLLNKYNIKYRIVHTVSIFNIADLEKNMDYYSKNLLDVPANFKNVIFNYVTSPTEYSISSLSYNIRNKLKTTVNKLFVRYPKLRDDKIYRLLNENRCIVFERKRYDRILDFDKRHQVTSESLLTGLIFAYYEKR